MVISAESHGTKHPIWAIRTMTPVCRIYVDFPPMFGPTEEILQREFKTIIFYHSMLLLKENRLLKLKKKKTNKKQHISLYSLSLINSFVRRKKTCLTGTARRATTTKGYCLDRRSFSFFFKEKGEMKGFISFVSSHLECTFIPKTNKLSL